MLAGVHNLLQRCGVEWLRCLAEGSLPRCPLVREESDAQLSLQHAESWLLSDDEPLHPQRPEAEHESGEVADFQARSSTAQTGDGVAPGSQAWAEFNRAQRGRVQKWMGSNPLPWLIIAAVTLSLSVHVLHVIERVASQDWQYQQWACNADTGGGCFRVQELLQDKMCTDVIERGRSLLMDSSHYAALPRPLQTWRLAGVAFCMLSTSLCSMEHYMFQSWRLPPYSVFGLVTVPETEQESVARSLLQVPQCMLDGWSARLLRRFNTVDRLLSRTCLAIIACVASLLKFEITDTECRHASVRRLQRSRSSTHVSDISRISADFTLQMSQRFLQHPGVCLKCSETRTQCSETEENQAEARWGRCG